ncbi:MAG: PadR family transcriptional regulator [Anaerolineaceae bacterium]|jgi:DNA-binding PadR family transcriptional regulator
MAEIQQLPKSSAPSLILSVLAEGNKHGYAILRELDQRCGGYFSLTAALLYPALHQMEQDRLVTSRWEQSVGQPRRKVYAITPAGRKRLNSGQAGWRRFISRLSKSKGEPDDFISGDSR